MALSIDFRKFFMVTILLVLFSSHQFAKAEKLYLDANNKKAKAIVNRKELKLDITTGLPDEHKPGKKFYLTVGSCNITIVTGRRSDVDYDVVLLKIEPTSDGRYDYVEHPRSLTAIESEIVTFEGSNGKKRVFCQSNVVFEEYKPNKFLVEVELSGDIHPSFVLSSESQVYNSEKGSDISVWLIVLILSILALVVFFASSSSVGGYKMYKKKKSATPLMQEAMASKSATLTVSKESAKNTQKLDHKQSKTNSVLIDIPSKVNEAKKKELTEGSETSAKSVK